MYLLPSKLVLMAPHKFQRHPVQWIHTTVGSCPSPTRRCAIDEGLLLAASMSANRNQVGCEDEDESEEEDLLLLER